MDASTDVTRRPHYIRDSVCRGGGGGGGGWRGVKCGLLSATGLKKKNKKRKRDGGWGGQTRGSGTGSNNRKCHTCRDGGRGGGGGGVTSCRRLKCFTLCWTMDEQIHTLNLMQCNFLHEGRTKSMSFLWKGLHISDVTTMQGLKSSCNVTLYTLILDNFLYRASSSQITYNKDFESSHSQLTRLGTFSSINSTSGSDRNVSSSKWKSGGKCGKILLNTTSQVIDWPAYGTINSRSSRLNIVNFQISHTYA